MFYNKYDTVVLLFSLFHCITVHFVYVIFLKNRLICIMKVLCLKKEYKKISHHMLDG